MSDEDKYGWNHDMICDSTNYYRMQGYNCSFSRSTKAEALFLKEKATESFKEVVMARLNKEIDKAVKKTGCNTYIPEN